MTEQQKQIWDEIVKDCNSSLQSINVGSKKRRDAINSVNRALAKPNTVEQSKQLHYCKYVKRFGESCTLNNNCKYPNCE